jgi:hypothetical protein
VYSGDQVAEGTNKIDAEHWFSSRKCYASPLCIPLSFQEKVPQIPLDFFIELLGSIGLSQKVQGAVTAYRRAAAAAPALCLIYPVNQTGSGIDNLVYSVRAGLNTQKTTHAQIPVKHQLSFPCPGFRIMTPQTPQGTAFKKDRGPDTRPVMEGKTLDIKDWGFRHTPPGPEAEVPFRIISRWSDHRFPAERLFAG